MAADPESNSPKQGGQEAKLQQELAADSRVQNKRTRHRRGALGGAIDVKGDRDASACVSLRFEIGADDVGA